MATILVRKGGVWVPLLGAAPPPPQFPDATVTGIPAGTTLTRIPEDVTSGTGWVWDATNELVNITGASTVFSGFRLTDGAILRVLAAGVTVQNSKIVSAGTGNFGIRNEHVSNTIIKNCEISGTRTNGGPDATGNNRLQFAINDVYKDGTNITVQNCNIYDTANSINILSGAITGNYIHDMGYIDADHIDCIIAEGASSLTISGNTLLNSQGQTACVALYSQSGPSDHVTVSGNLMAGGGYCIYGADFTPAQFAGTNIAITNNRFSTRFLPNGGQFGVLSHFDAGAAGNSWSGNKWYDGVNVGAVIPA
jgi:hypothetical protein